jgi:hypothetical protein
MNQRLRRTHPHLPAAAVSFTFVGGPLQRSNARSKFFSRAISSVPFAKSSREIAIIFPAGPP